MALRSPQESDRITTFCSVPEPDPDKQVSELIVLFNQLFMCTDNTVLVAGDGEPVYLPSDDVHSQHRILFAHGYYSSALHEISHWCIAGKIRRQQVDFGYWYVPEGRSQKQQKQFESVEIKPQALEWLFSLASGQPFHISVDNFNSNTKSTQREVFFKDQVYHQAKKYMNDGLSPRANAFVLCLLNYYHRQKYWNPVFLDRLTL